MILLAPLVVLALDAAAKLSLATEPGLLHRVPALDPAGTLRLALVVALALRLRSRSLAVVAAGVLANSVDALDGSVPNPLTLDLAGGRLGFNPADAAIAVGLLGAGLEAGRAMATTARRRASTRGAA